jgi:hypothetical protein
LWLVDLQLREFKGKGDRGQHNRVRCVYFFFNGAIVAIPPFNTQLWMYLEKADVCLLLRSLFTQLILVVNVLHFQIHQVFQKPEGRNGI